MDGFAKPLFGKKLVVIGSNQLQNSLLATLIEHETGAGCETDTSIVGCMVTERDADSALVLLDCGLNDEARIRRELEYLGERSPKTPVALFNMRPGSQLEWFACVRGVIGIFYEDTPHEQLIKGLRQIFRGELWFSRKVMSRYLLKDRQYLSTPDDPIDLTKREKEIVRLIGTGAKNTDIAESLCLSTHTVKTHIYHIFKKVNVKNRLQAANWARKNL